MSDFVAADPNVLSGAPVFKGTRVLIQSLFDYLEGGDTLDDFLADFPTVRRDQAIGLLEQLRQEAIPKTKVA